MTSPATKLVATGDVFHVLKPLAKTATKRQLTSAARRALRLAAQDGKLSLKIVNAEADKVVAELLAAA